MSSYPDGYLFQYGDMVQQFYEACVALEIGQYSRIVETDYGYHILLRLPVDYDKTPFYYYRQGSTSTLRQIAAEGMFDETLYGWMNTLAPENTADFESISMQDVFVQDTH